MSTQQDLKYWLAFSRFVKIGALRFKKLYTYFPTMEHAWNANAKELIQAGLNQALVEEFLQQKIQINPDLELEYIHKNNIQIVTIKDAAYPKLLKQIFNPPALLFCRGNLENLNYQFNLAVVGSRKYSPYGLQVLNEIVKHLVSKNICIVSGLALGLDALAHQITLGNQGKTIAVLGGGVDDLTIQPRTNYQLAQQILNKQGTIISEYSPGVEPIASNFPQRNRIISGLSLGTLIIEAGDKSGSLITAFLALEQGREVLAVPGSIFNDYSKGTNKIIQKGAKLVTCANDILEELNLEKIDQIQQAQELIPESKEEQIILDILSSEPIHFDELVYKSKLMTKQIASTLTLMEMKGKVKNLGGQKYIKCN